MTETTAKPKAKSAKAARRAKPAASERHLKITLVRSLIGSPKRQRDTARGLGLRKLGSQVVRRETPEILGMVRKVAHVVKVEAVDKP